MKREQEAEKIFSSWFSECSSIGEIREVLSVIHDKASQEAANRVIELEN